MIWQVARTLPWYVYWCRSLGHQVTSGHIRSYDVTWCRSLVESLSAFRPSHATWRPDLRVWSSSLTTPTYWFVSHWSHQVVSLVTPACISCMACCYTGAVLWHDSCWCVLFPHPSETDNRQQPLPWRHLRSFAKNGTCRVGTACRFDHPEGMKACRSHGRRILVRSNVKSCGIMVIWCDLWKLCRSPSTPKGFPWDPGHPFALTTCQHLRISRWGIWRGTWYE